MLEYKLVTECFSWVIFLFVIVLNYFFFVETARGIYINLGRQCGCRLLSSNSLRLSEPRAFVWSVESSLQAASCQLCQQAPAVTQVCEPERGRALSFHPYLNLVHSEKQHCFKQVQTGHACCSATQTRGVESMYPPKVKVTKGHWLLLPGSGGLSWSSCTVFLNNVICLHFF